MEYIISAYAVAGLLMVVMIIATLQLHCKAKRLQKESHDA